MVEVTSVLGGATGGEQEGRRPTLGMALDAYKEEMLQVIRRTEETAFGSSPAAAAARTHEPTMRR